MLAGGYFDAKWLPVYRVLSELPIIFVAHILADNYSR